jgi:hypothetical protein
VNLLCQKLSEVKTLTGLETLKWNYQELSFFSFILIPKHHKQKKDNEKKGPRFQNNKQENANSIELGEQCFGNNLRL